METCSSSLWNMYLISWSFCRVLCDEMLCQEGGYVYPVFPHVSSVLIVFECKLKHSSLLAFHVLNFCQLCVRS
jgi:hypothetical protein